MAVNNSINTGALSAGIVKTDGVGNLSTTAITQHDVLVGGSSNAVTSVGPGSAGQILLSGGASADPSYVTPTAGTGLSITTNASTLTYTLSTPVSVANGGTGASSFTAHSLIVGEGTSAMFALGAATNGQIPIGSTGADPVLATITGGSGITVSNGAGTITISASGSGVTWNDTTGTSATLAASNGYVADNGSLVTFTLPVTAAFGAEFIISGKGAGGWTIAQNSGQTIFFGTSTTTTGATGSLSSTNRRDTVHLVCCTANNDFNVLYAQGNLTVV